MKPSDLFKLAVRVLGLLFLYQAVLTFCNLLPLLTAPAVRGMAAVKPTWGNYLAILLLISAAAWCFFGAPPIQRLAYPEDPAAK